jgi:hypothetical protein
MCVLINADSTGYGTHGDYVFGWKDDALQKIMDDPCYVNCQSMRTQTMDQMNSCTVAQTAKEDVDDCKLEKEKTSATHIAGC